MNQLPKRPLVLLLSTMMWACLSLPAVAASAGKKQKRSEQVESRREARQAKRSGMAKNKARRVAAAKERREHLRLMRKAHRVAISGAFE